MCNTLQVPCVEKVTVDSVCGHCPRHSLGQAFTVDELVPKSVCPLLAHTLAPYHVTFSNGGWFRWVKRHGELILQCPNPDQGVVFGVTPERSRSPRTTTLCRVREVRGKCPHGYRCGDVIRFGSALDALCPEAYNTLFPYLLLAGAGVPLPWVNADGAQVVRCPSRSGGIVLRLHLRQPRPVAPPVGSGCFDWSKTNLTNEAATLHRFTCRYHPQPEPGRRYTAASLCPQGMCLDAFHAVYPRALAMLYDAAFGSSSDKEAVEAICPSPCGAVTFELRRVQRLSRRVRTLKHMAEGVLARVGFPPDIIDTDIAIRVVRRAASCPAGHQPDQTYLLNISLPMVLCPASTHAMFPYLALFDRKLPLPWGPANGACRAHCPDHRGFNYRCGKED